MVNRLNRTSIPHEGLPSFGGTEPLEELGVVGHYLTLWHACSSERVTMAQAASHQPSGWEANLREAADRMAETLKIRHEFLRLQGQVARQEREIAVLKRANAVITVPIQSFAPEPYEVLKPFQVVIQLCDDEFSAFFADANLTTAGANESEAIENLKALILDVFDNLTSKPANKLGPAPAKQLAVLREFIRKRS